MVSRPRGITLIELLLVMALIGIILLIAYPSFEPLRSKHTLTRDANHLAWTLRSARQNAITTGRPQEVEFKPYAGMYEYNGEVFQLSDGIQFVGTTTFQKVNNRRVCSFTSQGRPSFAGTVTLRDRYNNQLYIIVNPVGGRVRVSPDPPSS